VVSYRVGGVPDSTWRERFEVEQQRHRDLLEEISASARRRAALLEEGLAELGTKSAVARAVGIDVSAVRRSIREYGATPPPTDSTNK
jgi:DNA invertase Pin-like site-specific DNA recombinase